jgi:hypothetical protein
MCARRLQRARLGPHAGPAAAAAATAEPAPSPPPRRTAPRPPPQALGLSDLGCKLRAEWSEEDEASFALGMLWYLRPNKSVQRRYLPHKSLHQLQARRGAPRGAAAGKHRCESA